MIATIAALFVGAAGIWLLFFCWKQQRSATLGVVIAWLMMLSTIPLWSVDHGIIFGVCYALLAWSLQAGIVLWTQRERKAPKPSPVKPRQALNWPLAKKAWPKQLLLLLMVLPLSGISAMLLTTVLTGWLPWDKVDIMALGVYAMPLVWGIMAFWSYIDAARWRPLVGLAVISGACSLWIYG